MSRKRFLIIVVAACLALASLLVVRAQDEPFKNLFACEGGAFSTEEDFMMQRGEPFDGNPYISDGDILSPTGQVCVRNIELLQPRFDVSVDLGLDGLDILSFEPGVIAFSTELDSPHGTFTAGDLLVTNGAIIPNEVLTSAFGFGYDVGLDELKFMGQIENIREFLERAREVPREQWGDGMLLELLKAFNIDIWFSLEGTVNWQERQILDGDILSANGSIVATNRDLLAATVPAGIPNDGVDFGVDAFAVPREALGTERPDILFSTEILYRGRLSFTDGDVLVRQGGVVATNEALIAAFTPAARFLGLDALWISFEGSSDPRITHLCDIETLYFNGGTVPIGGGGTGLHESALTSPPALVDTLTQPCGQAVPIRGFLSTNPLDPVGDVVRFRVVYREASEPIPAAGDPGTSVIETSWTVYRPQFSFGGGSFGWHCSDEVTVATVGGWMDAQQFYDAKEGMGAFLNPSLKCEHPEMRLAVWNSHLLPVGETDADGPTGYPLAGVQDREDHYVIWLEWEDSGGVIHRENADHHLQLDNTLPRIADYPDGLQVRLPDGTIVPACGKTGPEADELQIWGQFDDRFYSSFSLLLRGGDPPEQEFYPGHAFYEPNDGTPSVMKATNDTGTMPDNTTVHLRNINLSDLGTSFIDAECCYYLEMNVFDRAIRHQFNGKDVNTFTGTNHTEAFITFAAQGGA